MKKKQPWRICSMCSSEFRPVGNIIPVHGLRRPLRCPTIGYPLAAMRSVQRAHPGWAERWVGRGGAMLLVLLVSLLVGCVDDVEPMLFETEVASLDFPSPTKVTMNPPVPPPPGLPYDATCVPVMEQCMPDLTCRVRGSHDGRCLPVGTYTAGSVCTSEGQCGANMICMQTGQEWIPARAGDWELSPQGVWQRSGANAMGGSDVAQCAVVCDPFDPLDRCQPNQQCVVFLGDDLGICLTL